MNCGRPSCGHDRAAHAIGAVDAAGLPHGPCSQCDCPGFIVPTAAVPPGAIGSDIWPGLIKLGEESGELVQVVAKVLAYPGGNHPDGTDIFQRLVDEAADVAAAIEFLLEVNPALSNRGFTERRLEKLRRFRDWHDNERPRWARQ